MLGAIIGGAISAGSSLLGGMLNNTAADNAADEAWDRQKKVLTKQIQWRVEDAVKAGLHPLAALSVNPASGPPAAAVFDSGLGNAGAALGDAVERVTDPMQKAQIAMQRLQLERATLDNDLIRSNIASQRMRNIQQSTPGVRSTTGNDVLVNPFTDAPFPMKHPDNAQIAQNAYGEPGEWWFGGANMVADWIRNNGMDPKQFYENPIGYGAQELRKATSSAWDNYLTNNWSNDATQYNWGY